MVLVIVSLSLLSIISLVFNYILYNSAIKQLDKVDLYESWILEFKKDINLTYQEMKLLDERNVFEKDDEVGVTFQSLLDVLKKLNERTQEEEEDVDQL